MPVQIINCLRRTPPGSRRIRKDALKLLGWSGFQKAELEVVLAGKDRIRRLNREFRGVDRPTDVLSFPVHDKHEFQGRGVLRPDKKEGLPAGYPFVLGEIVICPQVAGKNAAGAGIPVSGEMRRLLIHGFLHLLGYDHETGAADARRMRRKERELFDVLAR